ncbi:MAG: RNA polymerase sigma factor [Chloroflexi bacterium]|nr:RNA polymerase sigma factor [Chloroflexota bacterium]
MCAQSEANDVIGGLFCEYRSAIFAYIWRLVDNREWAEDLTQETFVRLFEARRRLPDVVNQRAWLYRIATNTTCNALRRRRRFAWLPWQAARAWLSGEGAAIDEIGQRSAVEAALAALPVAYRAPLLMHSHDDLTINEIAEALEISASAVKMRIYRAKEMFRRAYERENRQ